MARSNPQEQLINLQAQQLAAQVAQWAAQLEFQKERMRLLELPEMQGKLQVDIDRLAWEKAQDEWERAIKEATLTGTYNGVPTIEWMTQQAQLTGVLNGQQTLQGKLTDAQIKQMNDQMALANAQFMTSATGYLNGQKTFDRQKWEASQATDAWKFLATLTGPANAFKQARAIGSMPGGLSDIMGAWAGQFSPAGFAGVGSGGQASMENLLAGGGPGTPYYNQQQNWFSGNGSGQYTYNPPSYPPGGGQPPGAGGGGGAPPPGGYAPPPAAGAPITPPGGGTPAAPATPAGGLDAGFYVWLYHHGVVPGDPAQIPRMAEYMANYASLPAADHQYYVNAGQQDPANHTFNLQGWANVPGLPATTGFGGTQPNPSYQPPPYVPGTPVLTPPPNISQPPTGPKPALTAVPGTDTGQPAPPGTPIAGEGPGGGSLGFTNWADPNAQFTRFSSMEVMPYSYQPAGVQAPQQAWNYSPTPGGNMTVHPPGVSSDYSTPDISSAYPMSPQQAQNLYSYGGAGTPQPQQQTQYAPGTGGTTAFGAPSWSQSSLPLPNQISPQAYNNSYAYQRELGWAAYEDQGFDKALAQEAYERSLPRYGGPKRGSFAF